MAFVLTYVGMFCDILFTKSIFFMSKTTFCDWKVCPGSWIRIGLVPFWIRIRIEVNSWIRIQGWKKPVFWFVLGFWGFLGFFAQKRGC